MFTYLFIMWVLSDHGAPKVSDPLVLDFLMIVMRHIWGLVTLPGFSGRAVTNLNHNNLKN